MRKLILACLLLIVILSGCISNYYGAGWDFYNQGQTEKAIQYFEEKGTTAECPNCLCKIYSDIGEYERAIKNCEYAVNSWRPVTLTGYSDIDRMLRDNMTTKDKSFWVNRLVDAYSKTGQKERALETWKRYTTIDIPNDSNTFVTLAYHYVENKQYDEAIVAAKRAIELKSDNAVAYNNLGTAYGMKKQYDEAFKALKKAIEIDPKMFNPYDWMGRFLMEQNAYNEAIEAYKKVVELAPNNPANLFNLANTYRLMGKYDNAIETINKGNRIANFYWDRKSHGY